MANRAAICIVTPGALGSNPRVVKEADALTEAGYRVRVISTRTLDRVDERDAAVLTRSRWEAVRIDLRESRRWRRLRASQAAARLICGVSRSDRFAATALSAFTPVLTAAALAAPAVLYIAHYPAALPAAAAAARRHGAAYAYDAEDFHPGDWPDDRRYDLDRRLLRVIEAARLPGCAYVTAAAPAIADAYAQTYGIARPAVVLNCFPLENGPGGPSPSGSVSPGPSVYWFSQVIGPDRGLECAVQATGLAKTRPHLYLRGSLQPGFGAQLRALARQHHAADRLHFLEPAAPDDMERLAAAYDVGLAAETGHTAVRRLCLSNKLFSYLVAGLPPLMSATPAQAEFAREARLSDWLYPVDDAPALAGLMDRILVPDTLADMRRKALELAAGRFNWRIEAAKLVDVVGSALDAGRR